MKCIICKEERDPSEEHIIPKGIGGSLVTYRVCEECNGKLDHNADSELVNDWFMELKKFKHEIKGRRKRVKDPFGVGTLTTDPNRNIIFGRDKNGKPSIKIAPKIEIKNDKIVVNVDPKEKFNDIKNIVNKKLKRLGRSPLTEDQTRNLKLTLDGTSSTNGSLTINIQKKILEYPPYKGFVKIAYELGFYFLGEKYLNDATGQTLLDFILDTDPIKESLSNHKIEGEVRLIDHESEIEKRFKKINTNDNIHILAIFKTNHIIAVYIRLFSTYEGIIFISRTPHQYDDFKMDKLIMMDSKDGDCKIIDAKEEHLTFIMEKFPQN